MRKIIYTLSAIWAFLFGGGLADQFAIGASTIISDEENVGRVQIEIYVPHMWFVSINSQGGGRLSFGANPTDSFRFAAGTFNLNELLGEILRDLGALDGIKNRSSAHIYLKEPYESRELSDGLTLKIFEVAEQNVPTGVSPWGAERLALLRQLKPLEIKPKTPDSGSDSAQMIQHDTSSLNRSTPSPAIGEVDPNRTSKGAPPENTTLDSSPQNNNKGFVSNWIIVSLLTLGLTLTFF